MLAWGAGVGFSPNPYIIDRLGFDMPHRLDDPGLVSRVDSGNMLRAVGGLADSLVDLRVYRMPMVPRRVGRVESVLLMGMGGSGSAGDVLLDWLWEGLTIPVAAVRGASLPSFVGKGTLFVALSYSGDTVETLRVFRRARELGCVVAGVGSGGRLRTICREKQIPFFQVGGGLTPRGALGQMVAAGALALEKFRVVGNVRGELGATGDDLQRLRNRIQVGVPFARNRAKQVALSLWGRFPVVYSLERMSSVVRRFKNQLAENSKVHAKCGLLPEAGHNEIEAFGGDKRVLMPVLVRDWKETVGETRVVEAFRDTVRKSSGIRSLEVRVGAGTRLGRLMAPIMFLDYVSVYLAILRGVDPTPATWIGEYRRRTTGRD